MAVLGDSGAGLHIKVNGVFYLRGLVSSTLLNKDGNCDTTTYAVYTDVLKYKSWIDGSQEEVKSRGRSLAAFVQEEKEILQPANCGTMSGLLNASNVDANIFPWTVSIISSDVKKGSKIHLYTGTLISSRHVILQVSDFLDMAYSLSRLRMFFGPASPTTSGMEVSLITAYPDFKKKGNFIATTDVAVLLSARAIKFSDDIFPVCLPTDYEGSNAFEGKLGYTVGLNTEHADDQGLTISKNYVAMTVGSIKSCSSVYGDDFFNTTSSSFYCANPEVATSKSYQLNDPFYVEVEGRWVVLGFLYSCKNATVTGCQDEETLLYDNISTLKSLIRDDLFH